MSQLRAAAAWREIIVVDDGSADETAACAREAGACVVRHPYNKGNGAAVKSGIRRASGDFVLIIDADGQHPPEDAQRIVARLGEFDLVIGARAATTQATTARRAGNAVLNGLASYLTSRPIPDLTSGFRGRAHGVPPRIHPPAPERLLDADDDDAGVHQGGLQRRVRTDRRAAARRALEDPLRARRREVPADPPQDRDALQSRCASSCRSARSRSLPARYTESGTSRRPARFRTARSS